MPKVDTPEEILLLGDELISSDGFVALGGVTIVRGKCFEAP